MSDSFLCDSKDAPPQPAGGTEVSVAPKLENLTLSRQQLSESQKAYPSLTHLFETVVASEAVDTLSTGFLLKDDVLMRKFTPQCASPVDDWCVSFQIVVARLYRSEILSLAHKNPLSGNLGLQRPMIEFCGISFDSSIS